MIDKRFKVLKSSLDGVCGGAVELTAKDALNEISYHRGWDSIEQLREGIQLWMDVARPGQIFMTQVSAIVCVSNYLDVDSCPECEMTDVLDLGDIRADGEKMIQALCCLECGAKFEDVFYPDYRRTLKKGKIKKGKTK